jgi:hypothetical protein
MNVIQMNVIEMNVIEMNVIEMNVIDLACIIHDFSEKCLDSLPGEALSDYLCSTGYI